MGLRPDIKHNYKFTLKQCSRCGGSFGPESYAPTKSIFYPDGAIPICNDCMDKLAREDSGWAAANKFCQMCDIPFVPAEWERLREMDERNLFYRYASIFMNSQYDDLGWGDYYNAYKRLKDEGRLESELPLLGDDKRKALRARWGGNYDDEALGYLEDLFNGLTSTQNINGALQVDQALKICKMSYEIDRRIAEGSDFDKLLGSYDKLVKSAEFTPKNVKNLNDFDTFGEVARWMEKRGWRNKFYDRVTRDIVDETMKNFEGFNQRLYTNEPGIGEEISRRLEALNNTTRMENYYDTDKQYDLERYDNALYDDSEFGLDEGDFAADLEGK